jgi:hypothetical protein
MAVPLEREPASPRKRDDRREQELYPVTAVGNKENKVSQKFRFVFAAAIAAAFLPLAGCNGGSIASTTGTTQQAQTGTVNVLLSDDATEDWATIGVKVLSISLTPQGGGTAVNVYTAPSTPPMINLVQLDQLGEILGNATVPVGTYSAATLTLAANNTGSACDVSLVVSGDPESGFDLPAGTAVPCSQMVIAGAQGTSPNMTVPLTINLATPLTVTTSGSNALDLEFDLRHPALIVEHDPVGATAPTWAVNFNGPVRHHPRPDLTKVLLRHVYGQAASVSTDNTTLTIERAFPVHPITSPETATVVSTDTIPILADATNGTLFFDLDTSSTPTTIYNFSTVATALPGLYVRIAARYQSNGTLVATRILASSSFDKIWKNPEGHVLHANTNTNVMHVTTEDGNAKAIAIGPNTKFYFQSSDTVIGTGTTFFDGETPGGLPNVARGFKVNVTIDPLSAATPPVAQSVEIDVARYDGAITSPTTTDFDYTRNFAMADARGGKDSYHGALGYISSGSANLTPAGAAVSGFYWWDFGFPTQPDTGSNAVSDFVSATTGASSFGGLVGSLRPAGLSNATWNDAAASDTWSALWTVLVPTPAPLGIIATPFASSTDSFTYTVPLPTAAPANSPAVVPVTVDLTATSGSATLVYQVDRQGGIITVTPQDISNASVLATVGANLVANVPVKVFGVPQVNGSIKAYALFYYTHTVSTR